MTKNQDPNLQTQNASGDQGDSDNGHMTMFDRWDADDKMPMQVWFDSLDDLLGSITGYNSFGVPIFDPSKGIPDSKKDEPNSDMRHKALTARASELLASGKTPAGALKEMMNLRGTKDSDITRAIREAQNSSGSDKSKSDV